MVSNHMGWLSSYMLWLGQILPVFTELYLEQKGGIILFEAQVPVYGPQ